MTPHDREKMTVERSIPRLWELATHVETVECSERRADIFT